MSLRGYAPRVHKHMSLMAKVNHLAWFKGPIFQEAYLESTLPLEIPTAYSYDCLISLKIDKNYWSTTKTYKFDHN